MHHSPIPGLLQTPEFRPMREDAHPAPHAVVGEPLGPTGQFPGGRLTDTDEGEIRVRVGTMKGKVVVDFGAPTAWMGMDRTQALQLSRSLRDAANRL